jgi:hypothetical protein
MKGVGKAWTNIQEDFSRQSFTLIEAPTTQNFHPVLVDPRDDVNEIRNKARNETFDDGRVSTHHILIWSYFSLVHLVDD